MDDTDVSVIVPTYDTGGLMPTSLAHLEVQSHPAARFEVFIADHGNSDESAALIERYTAGAPVRTQYLRDPEAGFAAIANRAARGAQGKWLLFLDEDLLAGPRLVESHVQSQEKHPSAAAIVGRIALHPQVAPWTFTKWGAWGAHPEEHTEPAGPPSATLSFPAPFFEWTACNLSVPRQRFLDAGGFNENPSLAGMADRELAGRLHDGGVTGYFVDSAVAYAWRPTPLPRERIRNYHEGYALYGLSCLRPQENLERRLLPKKWRLKQWFARPLLPLCARWCPVFAGNTPLFAALARHVLLWDRTRGYKDAARGLVANPGVCGAPSP